MSKKHFFYTLIFISLSSFTVLVKSNFADLVNEKLNEYAKVNTPEKIYVHTDKPYYALGDDIWFSTYLVNGITHEKSLKSWVINIELINQKNIIVASKKLFTNNINAAGDFSIKKSWTPGKYQLRAYTKYMQNESTSTFFEKTITILDTKTTINTTASSSNNADKKALKTNKPDINFYPEGGYLVEQLRSKIVVKANHLNVDKLTGVIVDNNNTEISKITIADLGLGVFTIKALPNKSYKAIFDINGIKHSYTLPKALPKGHTLSVTNTKNHVILNTNSNTLKGLNNTYLVVHQRGKLLYSKYETEDKNTNTIKLPTEKLKDGVVHITLFNAEGKPVCERLAYVANPKNITNVKITTNTNIEKRKKIKLNLNVKNNNGNTLASKLSLSVRDLSLFPHNRKSKNIKTWLLLNSDLRGEIKNPGYFFDGEYNYKKQYLLDLTMLTNGWRRFNWQELLFNSKEQQFPVEKGLTISGTTKNLNAPYKAKQTHTRLTFLGKKITQNPITQTDANGRFSYGPFVFYDSIQTLIESRYGNFKNNALKNRQISISLNTTEPVPTIKSIKKDDLTKSKKQLENFLKASKYIEQINFEFNQKRQKLEEVIIKANKKIEQTKREQEISERTTYGFVDGRLDLEGNDLINGNTVIDLLNTMPKVNAFNDNVVIRGNNGPPTILLDGLTIDVDFLTTLDATDVSFIDILEGANAALFSNSGNGVIAIYSKSGRAFNNNDVKRKPGIVDFNAKGFYTARTFFSPDHINGFDELTKADVRTTLYWQPLIEITEETDKEIEFFSSDAASDYLIEVQGLSNSGIPLHAISTFSVN